MINQTETDRWSKIQFVTYLLLCVADADLHVDEAELEEIKNHLLNILDEGDCEATLMKEVLHEIRQHTDEEKKRFIEQHLSDYIHSPEEKEEIINAIEEIIVADLNVDVDELSFYRFLKRELR